MNGVGEFKAGLSWRTRRQEDRDERHDATTTIALVPSRDGEPTGIEVSFTTKDAEADHMELRARGVEADAALMRMGDLVPPMFTFRDPDGNRFRMVEGG